MQHEIRKSGTEVIDLEPADMRSQIRREIRTNHASLDAPTP